jgi:hypothetical protein
MSSLLYLIQMLIVQEHAIRMTSLMVQSFMLMNEPTKRIQLRKVNYKTLVDSLYLQ